MLPLLCIGTPLVELHEEVSSSVLERYCLQHNAVVQAEERHKPLLRQLLSDSVGAAKVELLPGGGAAVAALVAARLAGLTHVEEQHPHSLVYIGGVGRDDLGRTFAELCRKDGILALLSETDVDSTGWRAVLRTKPESAAIPGLGLPPGEDDDFLRRGPMASVLSTGAGHEYKLDHLRFKVWESVEDAEIIYVEALFLTVSPESVRIVAEHCAKAGRKTFVMNLSARYICSFFRDKIFTMLPYIDYLIGNESEYMELAENQKDMEACKTLDDIISWLARQPRADGNAKKKRYVIATCGPRPTLVAATWRGYGVKVTRYPVPVVPAWHLHCKDGAGDAFTGGILYSLMMKASLDSCVHMALYAAQNAVQRTKPGFVFKDKPRNDTVRLQG